MSEALAAWNGYGYDVPAGPKWWARQDLNLGQIVPNDLA